MKYIIAILIVFAGYWYWNRSDTVTTYNPIPGATLSDAEKAYYIQVFDYTMDNIQDGIDYEWESHNGKGLLTPVTTYVSKSRSTCRHYTEEFSVGGKDGTSEGITCKRDGKSGWCRLKSGDAETCAMEKPGYDIILGGISVGNIDVNIGGVNIDTNISGPNVGGVGDVGAPDVNMPDAPKRPNWLPSGKKEGQGAADWLISN